MGLSRSVLVVMLVIIVLMVALGAHLAFTYPRVINRFSVSFTAGVEVERREFGVPIFNDWVQVEVVVSNGTSLWNVKLLSQDEVLWGYRTAQGSQTTYKSEWIGLSSGDYNLTFAAAGIGSLEAEIKVISKGGFW